MPRRNEFTTEEDWLNHLKLWFAGMAVSRLVAARHPLVAPEGIARNALQLGEMMAIDAIRQGLH